MTANLLKSTCTIIKMTAGKVKSLATSKWWVAILNWFILFRWASKNLVLQFVNACILHKNRVLWVYWMHNFWKKKSNFNRKQTVQNSKFWKIATKTFTLRIVRSYPSHKCRNLWHKKVKFQQGLLGISDTDDHNSRDREWRAWRWLRWPVVVGTVPNMPQPRLHLARRNVGLRATVQRGLWRGIYFHQKQNWKWARKN